MFELSSFQLISNFDNSGHRKMQDTVVGFKPLMYFCFDRMMNNDNGISSVAVTCPRVELKRERKIHKCCPQGQVYFTRLLNLTVF